MHFYTIWFVQALLNAGLYDVLLTETYLMYFYTMWFLQTLRNAALYDVALSEPYSL
jgi:hypothetical protein